MLTHVLLPRVINRTQHYYWIARSIRDYELRVYRYYALLYQYEVYIPGIRYQACS